MKTHIPMIAGLALAFALNTVSGKDHTQTTSTITGEVLDLGCYLNNGASGPRHADCAKKCIESGRPVGLKGKDGRIYLLIGGVEALNKQLAPFAAKMVTITGRIVNRDGFNAIENTQLVSR